jgi:hypothetical protein
MRNCKSEIKNISTKKGVQTMKTEDTCSQQTQDAQQIAQRIQQIKQELMQIDFMRPGNLTMQYRDPKNARKPYWQISYTRKGRSRTDYVKDELVDQIKGQCSQYERFKTLVVEWTDLALQQSVLAMKEAAAALPRRTVKRPTT